LRGQYASYTNYDMSVVGLVNASVEDPALVLSIDFGASGQATPSGFSAFTRPENPAGAEQTESYASPFAADGGQIGVTVGADVEFRDRGDDVAGPIGEIVDDFVFSANELTLSLSNLKAGDYHLVLYAHDRDFSTGAYRIFHEGIELGIMAPTSGVSPAIGSASARVAFHADGASDVTFELESLAAGNVILNGMELYAVEAAGGAPSVDLNHDGELDLADYLLYSAGMHMDLTGLPPAVAYEKGDLNGDFRNDYADFLLFRQAYDAWNGAGALATDLSVPEPTAAALALTAWAAVKLSRLVRCSSTGRRSTLLLWSRAAGGRAETLRSHSPRCYFHGAFP
jgi:hypothetical protein